MKVSCPICKTEKEIENNPYKPFCSKKCKLIDLGSWMNGHYRIEGEKISEETDQKGEIK